MALKVYNTLTRAKEDFVPRTPGAVGIYVCGPTVYGHSHLGHAKSYVSFDVVVRYLRYSGYRVLYIQNITDVGHLTDDADMGEDKVEKQSRLDRVHPMQLAEYYTRSYFEDMDALGVVRADIAPRASGHITEQIAMIEELLRKGFAYEANGSVYFEVSRDPGYGKLSGRSVEELNAGVRIEVKAEKRHPADFALWKKAEPGHIMRWMSPWGEGFPGWHIECSAMSAKYLGASFDIHGGGLENQFPHHECEIAQSECASGQPFAKYWLHNNMVTVDGKKMGKSLGNFLTLKDAFSKWHPQIIRFFVLQSHYRSTLDFSDDAVDGASRGLEKLNAMRVALRAKMEKAAPEGEPSGIDVQSFKQEFLDAMDDDFNAPRALAVLFDLTRDVNSLLSLTRPVSQGSLKEIDALYEELAEGVLGISLALPVGAGGEPHLEGGLLELLLDVRRELREHKQWALSDRIRHGLTALGVTIEDTKEGSVWKKTS